MRHPRHKSRRDGLSAFIAFVAAMIVVLVTIPSSALAEGEESCDTQITDPRTRKHVTLREFHNPSLAEVTDHELCFQGYLSNFDGADDDDDDGEPDLLGVPHFVIHRIDRAKSSPESRKRPSVWFTVKELADEGIAPTDGSYVFSKQWRVNHPDWYERGHLAQKYLLERIGPDAAKYSHNVVNAVPQRGRFNKTAWLDLECRTGAWANRYGTVWVIAGPIFEGGSPHAWLREPRRKVMRVAIPDSLFKIVIRKDGDGYAALAFVMPQQDDSYKKGGWQFQKWMTSIDQIQRLTRQRFLPDVDDDASVKKKRVTTLWPHSEDQFDIGCRKFASDQP